MKLFREFIGESGTRLSNDSRIKDEGFYSSVVPDKHTQDALSSFLDTFFNKKIPDDIHCTVMYSTKAVDMDKAAQYSKRSYGGDLHLVEWWNGHDDSGYLVGKIKSNDLVDEHNRLKKIGCKPTFSDYQPHITFVTPIKKDKNLETNVANANKALTKQPIGLTLINQKMDILKL